jgi:hypothetical protein
MDADDASSAEMRRRADRDADPLALDQETVERLLTGELDPGRAPPGYADVAALLAAATAAPSDEELAGKEAALAELRAVTRARAATGRSARPVRRRRRVGLAAVVVVGALVTGGAAAAATGRLPEPVREATRRILGTDGRADPAAPGAQPAPGTPSPGAPGASRAGQQPPTTGAPAAGPATTGTAPAPNPDLTGLCRAYLAGNAAGNGKQLDATGFQALARAAGGQAKIDSWCRARLLADPKPEDTRPGRPKPKDQPAPAVPADPGPGQGQGGPSATRSPSR